MILIDTNVISELFILPESDLDQQRRDKAGALMREIETGAIDAIIPEVVIHECYYVLVMRKRLFSAAQFAAAFKSLLAFPGWKITAEERGIYSRGLEISTQYPHLEFSDAVVAARAEAHDAELATFDRRLAKAYGGPIWADS